LACDFFVVVTVTFRVLYVFVVLEVGVRAVGEIGRLADRVIADDELDVPVLGLAVSAPGVAIRALKNAFRSPTAAAHRPAS